MEKNEAKNESVTQNQAEIDGALQALSTMVVGIKDSCACIEKYIVNNNDELKEQYTATLESLEKIQQELNNKKVSKSNGVQYIIDCFDKYLPTILKVAYFLIAVAVGKLAHMDSATIENFLNYFNSK